MTTADEQDFADYPLTQQALSTNSTFDHRILSQQPSGSVMGDGEDEQVITDSHFARDSRIDSPPLPHGIEKRKYSRSVPEGLTYALFKYPLLVCVLFILVCELAFYVAVRQYVNLHEALLTWQGRRKQLREQMRRATNYEQWAEAAQEMDEFLKLDVWRKQPESAHYDYRLIRRITRLMKVYRGDLQNSAMSRK